MFRVGLVGAGKRMSSMNLPVLNKFKDDLEIVGVTTKSGKISEHFKVKAPVFSSVSKMCEETNPDIIYISVPHRETYKVLMELLDHKIPVLVDTPISLNIKETQAVLGAYKYEDVPIGVVEDWIYLPIECFKKKLIESNVLGQIVTVENDYRTYDYHGTAQLRSYLPKGSKVHSIKQEITGYTVDKCIKDDGGMIHNDLDVWRATIAKMNNGSLMINKYSSLYKKMPHRISNSIRIYGTKGTVFGNCLLKDDITISVIDKEGKTHFLPIDICKKDNEDVEYISITTPENIEVKWINPFYNLGFGEFQVGIAYHIDKMIKFMKKEENILYNISDFFEDLKLFHGKL